MASPHAVKWLGAQRDVLSGDVAGKVSLAELAGIPHLYALGPVEGLDGEVSVFDGVPSVARVREGRVRVARDPAARACFLVYARVDAWRAVRLEEEVSDVRALEGTVARLAAEAGLDAGAPFPFRLTGVAERALIHVLRKSDGLPHTPERHEQAKIRFVLEGVDVEALGFHSRAHQGVFVPSWATVHVHVRTADDRCSGHLDDIRLRAGGLLHLPA